ncbi:hypothetical protein RHMOL_Rhmol03G0271700 [Rhododendron molle]|uniref:Uncharacterized protein n=1 Tax=Rhododendron molle TaxID=49168 RepID=A0ACC0PLJ0_RHOML|nr:hypothetical protein RHMOL_Rhmol03G0271700 [Rhododendron molle]
MELGALIRAGLTELGLTVLVRQLIHRWWSFSGSSPSSGALVVRWRARACIAICSALVAARGGGWWLWALG